MVCFWGTAELPKSWNQNGHWDPSLSFHIIFAVLAFTSQQLPITQLHKIPMSSKGMEPDLMLEL